MHIGVIGQKGGVGKTTIAVHLAVWLHEKGVKVAFVDADGQGSASKWISRAQPEVKIFQCQDSGEIFETASQASSDYEAIVYDGPGYLGEATKTIMAIADGVLIPTGPSPLDTDSIVTTLGVIQEVQETRKEEGFLPVVRLIPNKLKRRYRMSQQLLNEIDDSDVDGSSGLSDLSAFADAADLGTVVWRLKTNAYKASKEMEKLFDEILNDESTFDSEEKNAATKESRDVA